MLSLPTSSGLGLQQCSKITSVFFLINSFPQLNFKPPLFTPRTSLKLLTQRSRGFLLHRENTHHQMGTITCHEQAHNHLYLHPYFPTPSRNKRAFHTKQILTSVLQSSSSLWFTGTSTTKYLQSCIFFNLLYLNLPIGIETSVSFFHLSEK